MASYNSLQINKKKLIVIILIIGILVFSLLYVFIIYKPPKFALTIVISQGNKKFYLSFNEGSSVSITDREINITDLGFRVIISITYKVRQGGYFYAWIGIRTNTSIKINYFRIRCWENNVRASTSKGTIWMQIVNAKEEPIYGITLLRIDGFSYYLAKDISLALNQYLMELNVFAEINFNRIMPSYSEFIIEITPSYM